MNFDYIPLDKAVIDKNVREFEQNCKKVLSKIRFDKGFENSVAALHFMGILMDWMNPANVNIYHLVYQTAYDYMESALYSVSDDVFYEVLRIVNRWSQAFQCAYEHSSSINFSWAFRELLKEVNPLLNE